jgi:hypothetical protein
VRLGEIFIRIGDKISPDLNPLCAGNIDKDGMYVCETLINGTKCPTQMTGKNVGIIRDAGLNNHLHLTELRAYRWLPID